MNTVFRSAAAAAVVLAFAATASAVPVNNFSFEVPDTSAFAYNPDDSAANGGWDYSGGSGVVQQQIAFAGDPNGGTLASDGTQLGFLQGQSEIAQNVIGGGLVGGQDYVLSFDAAGRADNLTAGPGGTPTSGQLSVMITDVGGGNGFTIMPYTDIAVGLDNDAVEPNSPKSLYSFDLAFTNPTNFGDRLRIRFLHRPNPAAPAADVSTLLDNVRLEAAPIPEPASLGLLGAGALALLRRRTANR